MAESLSAGSRTARAAGKGGFEKAPEGRLQKRHLKSGRVASSASDDFPQAFRNRLIQVRTFTHPLTHKPCNTEKDLLQFRCSRSFLRFKGCGAIPCLDAARQKPF